jgi:predicted TIM-barrel fold metal-dependent hydrolase
MPSSSSAEIIIDIHRHLVSPNLLANLATLPNDVFLRENPGKKRSPQKDAPTIQTSAFNDIDVQVHEQDQAGVTKGLLGNGSLLADIRHDVGSVAQDVAKIVNDDLAAAVSTHPSKLDFLATVHPFEPGFTKEIDRSLTKLGAKGLTLTSSYAGRWLDAPTLEPFWEYVQSRDVTIFLHPSINPTWLPNNDSYRVQEMMYRPFDVVTTVIRMVCSGVFDRYPQLKIVIPFTGAGIMDLLGRLDYFHQKDLISAPGKDAVTCQRPPSSYIGTNVYTEIGMSFSPIATQKAVQVFGSDHVLFGTDTPVAPTGEQLTIVKQLNLSPSEREQILWKNSNELFHLNISSSAVIP